MKKTVYELLDLQGEENAVRLVAELGQPKFRAKQLTEWLVKGASARSDFKNLPGAFLDALETRFELNGCECIADRKSSDGTTRKLLLRFNDGETAEFVIMTYKTGVSLCVSTQIGCGMNCAFCASGVGGFVRNLSAAELCSAFALANKLIQTERGVGISHMVLMGTGEPLANYNNVVRFIRLVHEHWGMSCRNVTLSTCGLVPGIEKLAEEELPITLALSLHSALKPVRDRLMPSGKAYTPEQLVQSTLYYFKRTGRRPTLEYILIKDLTDTNDQLSALCKLTIGKPVHVNLIPYNEGAGQGFERSLPNRVKLFADTLAECHVDATVRRELGADIEGACGQLRRQIK